MLAKKSRDIKKIDKEKLLAGLQALLLDNRRLREIVRTRLPHEVSTKVFEENAFQIPDNLVIIAEVTRLCY